MVSYRRGEGAKIVKNGQRNMDSSPKYVTCRHPNDIRKMHFTQLLRKLSTIKKNI